MPASQNRGASPLRRARRAVVRPAFAANQLFTRPVARPTAGGVVDALRGGDALRRAIGGRVVLVTGSSSGIGRATAVRAGAAGAVVVLVARGREGLAETAATIRDAGGTADVRPCDLTDLEAVDELVAGVLAEHGRVDVLVNNAGRSIRRSLEDSYGRFHDYERTMQLNYFAPVRLMLGLLPGMRERGDGHVVNISTWGVQHRAPRFGAYVASKAALDTLADAWHAETSADGVDFTTIHMSLVRTPMIAPTKLYARLPALSARQAGAIVCGTMITRPRRVSPVAGSISALADAVSPELMDVVRERGFRMLRD